MLKKLAFVGGLTGILAGCAPLPQPIYAPLPESAVSKDGKLTWHRTECGYIVEGEHDGRYGRFEYIAHDKDQGPYVRASTKEKGIPVEGYDGDGPHLLDGHANRMEVKAPFIGHLRFTCADGADPAPQNGYDAQRIKEIMDDVNKAYRSFYEHIQAQFDPELVRIAWETDPPWKK